MNPDLRHQPYTKDKIKYEELGAFYAINGYVEDTCPIMINAIGTPTNGYIADLLNEWNDWLIELTTENKQLNERIDELGSSDDDAANIEYDLRTKITSIVQDKITALELSLPHQKGEDKIKVENQLEILNTIINDINRTIDFYGR